MKEEHEHTITFRGGGVNQLNKEQRRFMMLHEINERLTEIRGQFVRGGIISDGTTLQESIEDYFFEEKKQDILFLL